MRRLFNLSILAVLVSTLFTSFVVGQSCDTLRNYTPPSDGSYTVWQEGANGMLLGQYTIQDDLNNSYDIGVYAEEYTTGGVTKQIRVLRYLPSLVENNSGNASIDFVIYSDNNGEPGAPIHIETVDYDDIAYDPNTSSLQWNTLELSTPVSVTGNFWVGYEPSYSTPWDKFQLATTRPSVNHTIFLLQGQAGAPLNGSWHNVNDVFSDMDDVDINSAFALDVLFSDGVTPVIDATVSESSICLSGEFQLDASSSTGSIDVYEWWITDNPPTQIYATANGMTTTISPTTSTPSSQRIYLWLSGACVDVSGAMDVIINPDVTATVSTVDASCNNNNGEIQITNAAGGNGTYSYSIDGGVTFGSASTFTGLAPGTYDVEVTTLGNGCVYSEQVTIQDSPGETISVGNDETICAGQTATLTASGNGTIEWFEGGNSLGTGNSITVSPTAVGANTYDVILTDANGCTDAGQVIVTVNPQDNAAFNYPSNTLCTGSSNVTPTISGTQNGTFSVNNTDLVIDPTSGEIDVNGSVAGTYIVTYSTTGLCPSSQTATITITTSPDASFSYNDTEFCSNDGVISPSFAPGASAGSFSSTTGLVFANSSTGEINLNASDAGTYTVTNTIAASGSCPAVSETFVITVFESPIVTATADETEVCAGDEVTLTATTSAGSVTWDNGVTNGTPFTPATTTTYTVTANDNGCEETQQITITVNEIPTITVTADETEVCTGEEVTLTATASAGTISWDNGVNNGTPFTPTATTTYTVTANDNGCEATEQITITVNELPNVSIDNGDLLACVYHNPIELTGIPAGGTFSGTGVTNNSFDPDAAGEGTHTITYTYEDAEGCENSATIQIEVDGCVGISTNELNNQVVLYPNPSTNYIDVALLGNHEMASVVVISLEGKIVNTPTKTVDNQTTRIDVSSLSVGTYLVQISTNNGTITKKIMVQ